MHIEGVQIEFNSDESLSSDSNLYEHESDKSENEQGVEATGKTNGNAAGTGQNID